MKTPDQGPVEGADMSAPERLIERFKAEIHRIRGEFAALSERAVIVEEHDPSKEDSTGSDFTKIQEARASEFNALASLIPEAKRIRDSYGNMMEAMFQDREPSQEVDGLFRGALDEIDALITKMQERQEELRTELNPRRPG
ncbi:hypothetical protein HY504_01275 [Candidatus Wolfebacteria bacterium]|nr:hypothetical protein [Candidatus Wolfebacteria bacterium]